MAATSRVLLLTLASAALMQPQSRDASAILADMRRALGGDAVLDGIKTFTVNGDVRKTGGPVAKSLSYELLALLPDHYMTIERDLDSGGFRPIDITYFNGVAGNDLIRRTDSNIPFPPDPGPQTPDAIAQRQAQQLLRRKQEFGRLTLALLGRSLPGYPWQFSAAGTDTLAGRAVEFVEARAADGFTARLYVDASTHLPVVIAWHAPVSPVIVTSSSTTVVTRGNQVMSQSPPTVPAVPPGDPATGRPDVIWKLDFSDFKVQDGVNWPHRMKLLVNTQVREEIRLGRFKINPRLDAKRFDVK